jgi:hypothetical protein
MATTTEIVEIRTLADLLSLFDVASEGTLTKEQYRNPLRGYRLYQPEACCQYLKNGKRCSQMHQHGFIVELQDDSKVLIGNCCALRHLGLDDDQVLDAFRKVTATERENVRRHRIESLLTDRESLISRVKTANIQLRELEARANRVLETLPGQVADALLNRWRQGTLDVAWQYQIVKAGKDVDGERVVDKNWYPHSFGRLKGMGAWLQLDGQGYREKLLSLRRHLDAIPTRSSLSRSELDAAELALREVATLEVVERELATEAGLLQDFLEFENLRLVIHIVSNQKERAKAVTAVHQLTGEPLTIAPEKYVSDFERALKQHYKSNSVRIM